MRILEVKNNLVKISYESNDDLMLSGFVIIEDKQFPYVAQVMSLKADNGIKYAIVNLLFTFDSEGVVKNYNGTIPDLDATITKLSPEELLDILPIEKPFPVGKLAQQNFILNIDYSTFENNLLVCSDNLDNKNILLSNIAKFITSNNDKSIIFDTTGTVNAENKLVFGKDYKLPLNISALNYIYDHDLNDISPTSKAIIQDILLEVQEYTETLIDKFIPFDLFLNVIAAQAKKTKLPELSILKNRLIKYKQENIFAQEAADIYTLRSSVRANLSTTLDISNVDSDVQNLIYSIVYDELNSLDLFIYSLVNIDNENSNKRLLKRFLNSDKIYTTIFCPHNYRYIHELKEISSNMIMFEPQTMQHDFNTYNVFLNKLNPDEAIIYGKATQNIPLIIEMMPIELLYDYKNSFIDKINESGSKDNNVDSFDDNSYTQESMMTDTQDYSNSDVIEQVAAQVLGQSDEDEETNNNINDDDNLEENSDQHFDESTEIISEQNTDEDADMCVEQNSEAVPDEFLAVPEIQNVDDDINSNSNSFDSEFENNSEAQIDSIQNETNYDDPEPSIEAENYQETEDEFEETNLNSQDGSSDNSDQQSEQVIISDETLDNNTDEYILSEEVDSNDNNDNMLTLDDLNDIDNIRPNSDTNIIESELIDNNDEMILSSANSNPDIQEESEFADEFNNELPDLNFNHEEYDDSQSYNESNINVDNTSSEEDNPEENVYMDDVDDFANSTDNFQEYDENNRAEDDSDNYINDESSQTSVPIYSVDEDTPLGQPVELFEAGDNVTHPKYGEGVVEKMVKFGNKILCSVNFSNGRRLLDPTISQLSKI